VGAAVEDAHGPGVVSQRLDEDLPIAVAIRGGGLDTKRVLVMRIASRSVNKSRLARGWVLRSALIISGAAIMIHSDVYALIWL
jgi:hypothetical protein